MASTPSVALPFNGDIILSANDKRKYRYITLSANGLPVLLVSDPETEKSAACCDVHVGSLSDPAEAQGLAHFLEHMLFMGTEKYPTENAYSAYLNNHGGSSNAYTSTENTVYYFDVLSDHFEGALDLFSTFFTCPLFTESGVMREIQAVDSENSKNLQNDWWRKFQLFKNLSRPDHALNSFSTGNLETLHEVPSSKGMNIRQLMIDFYNKYYSANLMRLTVYGAASLDQLEAWTVEKFSGIVNKNLQREIFPSDPFRAEQLKKMVEVVPVRDLKNIEILFPLPPIEDLYLTKPAKYFGHLIGHESGGSILAALKAKRWANALSCYPYPSCRDFACYVVSIDMTEEGVLHVEEIVSCVFAYIGMVKRAGPQDWVWQELRDIAEMNFRFLNKISPIDYIVDLSNNMQIYPPQHVLAGQSLHFQKDLDQAMEYLSYLTPDNALYIVSHKGFDGKTSLTERWYKTPYNMKDVDGSMVEKWKSYMETAQEWEGVLQFPQPNPFIPEDFSLKATGDAPKYPQLLTQDVVSESGPLPVTLPTPTEPHTEEPEDAEDSEDADAEETNQKTDSLLSANWLPILPGKNNVVWFKDDSEHLWDVPKTFVTILYESYMGASISAWQVAMTDVYSSCLNEVLSEYSYYADCAGISFSASTTPGGINITAQGYSHKLANLVERACMQAHRIGSGIAEDNPVNESLFMRVKEKILRSYKNFLFSQPYSLCISNNHICLENPRWSYFEKYAALKDVTLSTFYTFAAEFLRYGRPEILITGNSTAEEAVKYKDMICQALQCQTLPYAMEHSRRGVDIFSPTANAEEVVEYVYRISARTHNPAEVNSAVENLYFVGPSAGKAKEGEDVNDQALLNEALLALLEHMMSEPAFDVLRTKEQLGYMVYTFRKRIAYNIMTLAMIVQSSHKDATYLDSRIENFLDVYREELQQMTAETLQSFIQAVIEKLLEKPKNLVDESSKYRDEIDSKTYLFDRKDRLVAKLRDANLVNHASVLDFFDTYLRAGSARRRKFSTEYYGKQFDVPAAESLVKESKEGKSRKLVVVLEPTLFKRKMPLLPVENYEPL